MSGPKRPPSLAFGDALRRAMKSRRYQVWRLAEDSGFSREVIVRMRAGRSIPHPDRLARLAEVLDCPRLVTLAREYLARTCLECEAPFVQTVQAANMSFCTQRCRWVYRARIAREKRREQAPALLKQYIGKAQAAEAHRDNILRDLLALRAAVEAFCRSCEWDGICKTPECELRDVSPLPLSKEAAA